MFLTFAYGTRLQYDPAAATALGGIGCAGTIGYSNAGQQIPPYAGSELVSLQLTGGIPNAPTALALGVAAMSVPLSGGCFLNVGPQVFVFANAVASGAGGLTVPVPFMPPVVGDLYWQFLQVDSVNSRLVSTQSLKTSIR